jgi:hypothetical protein
MKVTITTTSQNLETILGTTYSIIARASRINEFHRITISNEGSTNIYVSLDPLNRSSATTDNFLIPPNKVLEDLCVRNLSDVAIISETSNNTSVRILSN